MNDIGKMNLVPIDVLDMRGKNSAVFRFKVERNGIGQHLILSHHQSHLDGFKLSLSTQQGNYNHKLPPTNEFEVTLIRNGTNTSPELDIVLGVCTYPINKTVMTFKVLI